MSIAGIGSGQAGLAGLQYDFTRLTNRQILDTSKQLLSQGKISPDEAGELAIYARGSDWVPINGHSPSAASVLSDPTQRNLLGILSEWSAANHTRVPFLGEATTDNLLKDLSGLQSGGPDVVREAVQLTARNYADAFTPNFVDALNGPGDATTNSLLAALKQNEANALSEEAKSHVSAVV